MSASEKQPSVIRVMVVDDHAVVRRGLRHLLESSADMSVVGEAEDGPSAVRLAAALLPDVILLDVRMPGPAGYEVAPQLRAASAESRIIMLTTYEDDEFIARSIGGGAHGYLLKSAGDESVAAAIRAVYRGERLVTPSLMSKVLGQMEKMSRSQSRLESGLSDVETDVLGIMVQGATNKQIARQLNFSERTVKRRVHAIIHKLGVTTRAQAVVEASRRGII
jgi:two-component system NarL family response regulator